MTRIGIVQMNTSAEVAENMAFVEKQCAAAAEAEASMLVLPENFAFMGRSETDKLAVSEQFGEGFIQDAVSRLAKRFGLWVIAGTLPLRSHGNRVRASCLVYDDRGLCAARYDKIHLFDVRVSAAEVHAESNVIEPGEDAVLVDTPAGRTGLTVCYDLRFPELYRLLAAKGATVFTVVSAFTKTTGEAHWEVLLRARAIENQAYVLAPDQAGVHASGRETWGHSMAVDPWGRVCLSMHDAAGTGFVDIDTASLQQLRDSFPCDRHRVLSVQLPTGSTKP